MAQTNDTIDGLLAEFRGYAAGMPPSYHVTMSWHDFRRMLDRFDAAHKRERGNSAVMYAALMKVKKLFDGQIMFQPAIREAHEAVNAALAAPPRNCDRFDGDIDKLREACARERGLNPEEDFPDVFPGWLLAPSTKQEGDAK